MNLTDDQQKAFEEIKEFIRGKETAHVLVGFAGTGKSFLTKYILEWCQQRNISVAGLCATHKARKVLDNILNSNSFTQVHTMTVASFLMKLKQHSYVGTKNFKGNGFSKASQFDLFFIDECSMLADRDVDQIVKHIKNAEKKALFIGDKGQIPSPSQEFEENEDGTISKKDSKSFECPTSLLTEIKRQQDDHPLLEIYTMLRNHTFTEPEIDRINNVIITPTGNKGVKFYDDYDRFLAKIKRTILGRVADLIEYRAIAYTNDTVKVYNKYIRNILGYEERFVIGDILVGYNNVGWPIHFVENGQEYYVNQIKHHKAYLIRYGNQHFTCSGTEIEIKDLSNKLYTVFFPTVNGAENQEIFAKLKELAKNVNKKGSTTKEFKAYSSLKNQLLFMENVYEYGGKVMAETELKERDPKLFHLVSYYITSLNGKLKINGTRSVEKFIKLYPTILQERVADNKPISDSERLIDRYQLIEKDIDYGYAITCHKSQGSTYHTVFIDEQDFSKIGNKWNYKYEAEENGTKERNQLKYVAYTRPSHLAIILF